MAETQEQPEIGAGQTMPPAHATSTPLARIELRRPTESPDLITKQVFAQRTSMSVRSVEKLLAERRIPHVRMTRKLVRIPWAEAVEHMRRNYTINAR